MEQMLGYYHPITNKRWRLGRSLWEMNAVELKHLTLAKYPSYLAGASGELQNRLKVGNHCCPADQQSQVKP